MDEKNFIYLAGLIDADGCFSIPIRQRKTKIGTDWLNITPMVRVGMAGYAKDLIEWIQQAMNCGKIYWSNKGKENQIIYWQTTNWPESLKAAKQIYPYLRLKKDICKKFISACEEFIEFKHKYGRKARNKDLTKRIVKAGCELNSHTRQTKRYREVKNFKYWEPIIEKLY